LTEARGCEKEHADDPYVKETLKRINKEEDYDFLRCNYDHICGLRVKFKYYFTKDSHVKFKFPMGSKRDWCPDMWSNKFSEAREQESMTTSTIDWTHISPEDKFCTICDKQFESAADLVEHCDRDREHDELLQKFLLKEPEVEKDKR